MGSMCTLPAAVALIANASTGSMNAAAVVPEPTTLAIAVAAVVTVLVARRLR
jgi:hypothetical protein